MKTVDYRAYLDSQMAVALAGVAREEPDLHGVLGLAAAVLSARGGRTRAGQRAVAEGSHTTLRGIWIVWTTRPDEAAGLLAYWAGRAAGV